MTLLENNEISHSLKFQFIFRNDKLTSYNNLYIILIFFWTRFFFNKTSRLFRIYIQDFTPLHFLQSRRIKNPTP